MDPTGPATLQAIVEGELKQVRVRLPEQIMDIAAEAYERRLAVTATGDLTRDRRGWVLYNPTRLDLK